MLAALDELARAGQRRIEIRRAAADEFHHELQQALPHRVGCGNWYLDANSHSPNQWPWTWATYARRTRRLQPGAYQVGGLSRRDPVVRG
jgi:hypothetical protein